MCFSADPYSMHSFPLGRTIPSSTDSKGYLCTSPARLCFPTWGQLKWRMDLHVLRKGREAKDPASDCWRSKGRNVIKKRPRLLTKQSLFRTTTPSLACGCCWWRSRHYCWSCVYGQVFKRLWLWMAGRFVDRVTSSRSLLFPMCRLKNCPIHRITEMGGSLHEEWSLSDCVVKECASNSLQVIAKF